jgi:Ca2+-binding RTX toxin-like protein
MRAIFDVEFDLDEIDWSFWDERSSAPVLIFEGPPFWGRSYDTAFQMSVGTVEDGFTVRGYGPDLGVDPQGLYGGTLQALQFQRWQENGPDDSTFVDTVRIEGIAIAAADLDAAIKTASRNDELNLLASQMGDDDDITMSNGRDGMNGFGGNDIIRGRRGHDSLGGGAGDDTLLGQRGDDLIGGTVGQDRLGGGQGSDSLYGGRGDDFLTGYSEGDILFGGAGDDTISGGTGADVLTGDAGADVFRFKAGHGADQIEDFSDGVDRIIIRLAEPEGGGDDRVVLTAVDGGHTRVTVVAPDGRDMGIDILVANITRAALADDVLLTGL